MTIRIALLGAPSAGKSTLAAYVFAMLKENKIKTELVQEYVREHINKYGSPQNVLTQYLIYKRQREKEDIIPPEIEVIITDSPTILSYIYALHYADVTEKDHQHLLIDMYTETLLNGFSRYDYIFYLTPTRQYVLDGTRKQTAEEAKEIGNKILRFLDDHHVKYTVLDVNGTDDRAKIIFEKVTTKLKETNGN